MYQTAIKVMAVILTIFCSTYSSAQYGYYNAWAEFRNAKEEGKAGFFHRSSTGYGKFFINNKLTFQYKKANGIHETIERDLTTTASMHFEDNYFVPISGMGEKSILAFSFGAFVSMMQVEAEQVTLEDGTTYKLDFPLTLMGIPISLDYKVGGEATLNKRDNTMLTLGLGVAPGFYENYNENYILPFRAVAFAKAEVGFFLGLAFKLKANAFLSKGRYFDMVEPYYSPEDVENPQAQSKPLEVKSYGNFGYSLTLMVLPYSFDWSKEYR